MTAQCTVIQDILKTHIIYHTIVLISRNTNHFSAEPYTLELVEQAWFDGFNGTVTAGRSSLLGSGLLGANAGEPLVCLTIT